MNGASMANPWSLPPPDLAELVLLAAGALIILTVIIRLTAWRRWPEQFRLPSPPAQRLTPVDLATALLIVWVIPPAVVSLADSVAERPAASQVSPAEGDFPPAASRPENDAVAPPRRIAASACGQLIAAAMLIALGAARFENGLRGWGLSATCALRRAGASVLIYAGVWPFCFAALHLTVMGLETWFPNYNIPEHTTILSLQSGELAGWAAAVMVVGAFVLAPLCEELVFRGLLQPAITAWSGQPWRSILLCAVAFGMFHYPLVHSIPALTLFGIALGYVYARTRSLTLCVLIHAVFNGKTLLWIALGAGAHG